MNTKNNTIKMIYFPIQDGAGFKAGGPAIVHIIDRVGEEYRGTQTETEALTGRFSFFPVSRTFVFNQTLWDLCLLHIQKRQALEAEYKALQKNGKTYNSVAFSDVGDPDLFAGEKKELPF